MHVHIRVSISTRRNAHQSAMQFLVQGMLDGLVTFAENSGLLSKVWTGLFGGHSFCASRSTRRMMSLLLSPPKATSWQYEKDRAKAHTPTSARASEGPRPPHAEAIRWVSTLTRQHHRLECARIDLAQWASGNVATSSRRRRSRWRCGSQPQCDYLPPSRRPRTAPASRNARRDPPGQAVRRSQFYAGLT
jgi:hypothetical protein